MTTRTAAQVALQEQFGATIAMLRNAIDACPEDLWLASGAEAPFWYLAFHTLFWLDLYLSPDVPSFRPPPPFGLSELEPGDQRPEQAYTKPLLLGYLDHCHTKSQQVLGEMTAGRAEQPAPFSWLAPASVLEVHIYNLRHVQHGAAQLNLMLRHTGVVPPRWVQRLSATTTRLPTA